LPRLEKHSRAFIARSPFLVIASADASGRVDASPKGDAPGFVQILDDEGPRSGMLLFNRFNARVTAKISEPRLEPDRLRSKRSEP